MFWLLSPTAFVATPRSQPTLLIATAAARTSLLLRRLQKVIQRQKLLLFSCFDACRYLLALPSRLLAVQRLKVRLFTFSGRLLPGFNQRIVLHQGWLRLLARVVRLSHGCGWDVVGVLV